MIELVLAADGIRPTGHGWSRDGAEEAALELGALARFLAPGGEARLRTWRRGSDGVWRAVDRPLVDTTWRWDTDKGALSADIDGVRVDAVPVGRSFTLHLRGRPAARVGDAWVAGDVAIGRPGALAVTLRPGRLADGLIRVGRDGEGLPADTVAVAVFAGPDGEVALGAGEPDGPGWRWRAPDPLPAPPWGLALRLGIVRPGEEAPWEAAVPVVEPCELRGPRADGGGRVVVPGERLDALRFADAKASPARARLRFAAGGWSADVEAERTAPGRYTWAPPLRLPDTLPAPGAITVTADGQDAPVGALIVAPARVVGRWRLTRDARGDARRPALEPDQLALDGVSEAWSAAPGPDARFHIDGEPVRVPIVVAPPVLRLADPPAGLVDGAAIEGAAPGTITVWLPGLPPLEVPVDAEGRLRARGGGLRELATVAAARGLPVRLAQGDLRGVVSPAGPHPGLAEVDAWVDGPLWVVADGVGFAARVDGDGVRLDAPVPNDGRLGLDVPLPATVAAEGDTRWVDVGGARTRLRRVGGAWATDAGPLPRDRGDVAVGGVWLREEPRGWGFAGWVAAPRLGPGLRVWRGT